jgi:hypothetical protein
LEDNALEFKWIIEDSNIDNMDWDMNRIPFTFVKENNNTCDAYFQIA